MIRPFLFAFLFPFLFRPCSHCSSYSVRQTQDKSFSSDPCDGSGASLRNRARHAFLHPIQPLTRGSSMFLHLSCAWSLLFDKLQALRVVFVAPNACEALNAAVGSSQVTRESHVGHKVAIGCCHEPCPTSRTNRFCPICSAIQGTVPTVSTAPVVERASGFNMKSKSLKARPSSATMRN